jgi:two-component system, NtrC family, sensor kinase
MEPDSKADDSRRASVPTDPAGPIRPEAGFVAGKSDGEIALATVGVNRRILVIDDTLAIHEDFRKILNPPQPGAAAIDLREAELFGEHPATAMSAFPEFAVRFAAQGADGLALARLEHAAGRPFAVAFVDMRMPPGWDGIETIERLWAFDPSLQVVICTAYSDHSWQEMVTRLGHTDRFVVLKKPFDSVEVLQLASALTEKWSLNCAAERHLRDLERLLQSIERKVEERTQDLATSREQYRALVETTRSVPWQWDMAKGRFTYVGPQGSALLGCSQEEWLGPRFWEERVHADDRAAMSAAWSAVCESGVGNDFECRLRRDGGAYVTVRCIVSRLRADNLLRGFMLDVSEQRRLELELNQARKLESVGRLAAGIAHEINTPIQFVSDNLHFMREAVSELMPVLRAHRAALACAGSGASFEDTLSRDPPEGRLDICDIEEQMPKALDRSVEGLERMATLVRALNEFSHPAQKTKEPADLNHALSSTLTIAHNQFKYVAELKTDFCDLPDVYCHVSELNQAFLNLIVNAAHAIEAVVEGTDRKGAIGVTTRRDGDQVVITVSDTGVGIPEHVQANVFDPFFTTKEVGKGTGQGLAIARNVIVDKHGGSIGFVSEVGVGTTFTVRLPVAPSAALRAAAGIGSRS